MGQGYGREAPPPHRQVHHREVTRYLVIVPSTDGPIARLLLANREQVAELDGNTEEVTSMIKGVQPTVGATEAHWDKALAAHSHSERAQAKVYALLP